MRNHAKTTPPSLSYRLRRYPNQPGVRNLIIYSSPCHYMRAWIRVLDAPVAMNEPHYKAQDLGLVRTVGPCAQRRVALMPRAIATARDALSIEPRSERKRRAFRLLSKRWRYSASHRASSEARGEVCSYIPVSSPVATFEQSENVAIAHFYAGFAKGCGLCNRFHLRMHTVLMDNLAQAGYCLCMNYVSMFCGHVQMIMHASQIIP